MDFCWVCMPYGYVHPDLLEKCIASTFSMTKSGSGGCWGVWVEMNVLTIWESRRPSGQSEFGKGETNGASTQPVEVCFKNSGQISCNFPL